MDTLMSQLGNDEEEKRVPFERFVEYMVQVRMAYL